jgi:hypothetical protein
MIERLLRRFTVRGMFWDFPLLWLKEWDARLVD